MGSFAAAWANAEGFGKPGAIPTLANNPGDLELGDIGYGTITAAGNNQITVFPSVASGQAALQNQINKMANGTSSYYTPNQSLSSAAETLGGGSTWAQNVANYLGVSTDTSLASLAGLSGIANSVVSQTKSLAQTAIFGIDLEDWLFIIVGLLLIAAGLFAFKQTQTVIQNVTDATTKVGTKVAEIGAIAG